MNKELDIFAILYTVFFISILGTETKFNQCSLYRDSAVVYVLMLKSVIIYLAFYHPRPWFNKIYLPPSSESSIKHLALDLGSTTGFF